MSKETDEILEDAFASAVSLTGGAREEFIAAFGEKHPDLVERLRALVSADEAASDMLTVSVSKSVENLPLEDIDPWIGKDLGHYTISKRIGAGGMGAVFLAERTDDAYSQTVAIKIMTTQLLSEDAMSRFRNERQILASLNHPHIAKLIDGGSTDTGLPFLVMEYISGKAIDAYCETQNLNIRDKIKLFQKVCAAVDYAHRNLVVHRDLKPSNILIDEHGAPKLLDFGIAKLLNPDEFKLTVAQTGGGRIMTPDYASPEQVRGEKISIATDIYALGVLLFRLLTGQSPYGASTTPREIENAILNEEPKSPSSVVTQLSITKTTSTKSVDAHETRAKDYEVLRRSLAGDLDNIVLKCMQKDPERRYATAGTLAADLENYLRHKPVSARGDDWLYKTRKFMVRRARPLAIAASVTITIIGLTAYYTVQLAKERNEAVIAATQAREISTFLESLFESASPMTAKGDEITAIELLDAGIERIDQLSDLPLVQSELLSVMGDSYSDLGAPETAVELQERAIKILDAESSVEPLTLAERFARLAEAKRLHGQLREAEAAMRRALEIRKEELGPKDLLVADTMGRLGTILFDTKDLDEGTQLLRDAIAIKTAASPIPDEDLLDMRGNLSITLDSLGQYDEAEQLMRENIVLSEQINGELYPNTVIRLSNLGLLLRRRAKYQESLEVSREALRRAQITWPENHPNRAVYNSVVGSAYFDLGDFDNAQTYMEKGVEVALAGVGENHFRYVARIRTLGSLLIERGEYAEAEALLKKAISIATSLSDEPTYQSQIALFYLGKLKNRQGRYEEAESLLREALQDSVKIGLSAELRCRQQLAVSLSHQGRDEEVETLFADVIARHEAAEGSDSPILLPALTDFAAHHRRKGDLETALAYARRAQSIGEASLPPGHWHTALATAEHANILKEIGESEEATALAQRAFADLSKTLSPGDPRLTALETFL